MIIECSYCNARVNAKVVAQHCDPEEEDYPVKFNILLLECPTCRNGLLAGQDEIEPGSARWTTAVRLWPSPDKHFSWDIPEIVRSSIEEAHKCFKARAYSACAVMCGRALEGICRHHGTKSKNLGAGLNELIEKKVIDGRLLKWSEALRVSRNLGAHATATAFSKEEARDLVLFAEAICEYVFVLTAQFEQFMERKKKQAKKS